MPQPAENSLGPLSSGPHVFEFLAESREQARLRQWKAAAKSAEEHLTRLESESISIDKGLATDFVASCNFRAAFQSQTRSDFENSMLVARDIYGKAAFCFETSNSTALARGAESKKAFAEFWLETSAAKRDDIITNCVESIKSAIDSLSGEERDAISAQFHLELLKFLREGSTLSTRYDLRKNRFQIALDSGRIAVSRFESRPESEEWAESLSLMVWLLAVEAQAILSPAELQTLDRETRTLEAKLAQTSQQLGTPYAICLSKEAAGHLTFDLEGNPTKALGLYKESAKIASELEDSLLIGRLNWPIAHVDYWISLTEEDSEKRRIVLNEGIKHSSTAIRALEACWATTDLAAAYAASAECQIEQANLLDTDLSRKKDQLQNAIEMASRGTRFESGTLAWNRAAHTMAKGMYFLSQLENTNEKTELLKATLSIRQNTIEVADNVLPHFWEPVVMRNYLALVESELASLESDPIKKKTILEQARIHLERCLELGEKWASIPTLKLRLFQFQESYADILSRLFVLTKENDTAKKSLLAYESAFSFFAELKHFGTAAPIKWKIARLYDDLGDFDKASASFKEASQTFQRGAEKIPASARTFEEYRVYMEACSDIEAARGDHSRGDYENASQSYSNAASQLQSTPKWKYRSRLCRARSLLEKAELLSAEESPEAAIDVFASAIKGFEEARLDILSRLSDSEVEDQLDLKNWLAIAGHRVKYCRGRVQIEEAGILSRKGAKRLSAAKYRLASETFREASSEILSTEDRSETETFAEFCEAWGLMREAEWSLSPDSYNAAANLFLKAENKATREIFRLLASANASICKALEVGTKFRLNRDLTLYSGIKDHLESAANHYREAGFKKTENWTRATQRLFDALLFLSEAETEPDHRKKAEFYQLAEKQLEVSSKLYGEAGFPDKKKETLEQLGRTRSVKDALIEPLEALSQIPTVSGLSLASKTLPLGRTVEVERFENACIVGDIIVQQREIVMGSEFSISLELANVGKTPATLVKLQNMTNPSFEYVKEVNSFPQEDGEIDLRGRRVGHLKAYQVNLFLRPVSPGQFELRPRIFYVDDLGNYRSFQFPPASLTIVEKGPNVTPISLSTSPIAHRAMMPEGLKFETERAKVVFQCLVEDFLHDYMSRRIYVEQAGWRTLMNLIHETKIPRSAVYGPHGRHGPTIAELESRGFIETRIFPRERGRGGAVKKVRVAFENELIKRIVEESARTNA